MAGLLAGIEAGGTKFVVAVGTGPTDIRERARFDTVGPEETIPRVLEFLGTRGSVEALGIASFGPVELRSTHPDFGKITTTPKPGWSGFDLVGAFGQMGVPIGFATDVVGAALGEAAAGVGRDVRSLVYLTVGTGVGGGHVVDGRAVPELGHAEMGHIAVGRHPEDPFAGNCPYHGGCLEGMIAGPAIAARWGRRGEALGELVVQAGDILGHYLGAGLATITYTLAPERIVVGGGVSEIPGFLEAAIARLAIEMNGYARRPEHGAGYVVRPGLGGDAGTAGALVLAGQALAAQAPAG